MILFIVASYSRAQTFKEWFMQKQTQKEYLIEQIAALQVYVDYVEKGYDIARKGLNTIGNIKKGDLSLHTDYFNSLKSVSPAVQKYARVADIIQLQLEIMSLHKNNSKQIKQSGQFNAGELSYMEQVYSNFLEQSTALMDNLIQVTTTGKLEMKEDERIKRINALYNTMQDFHAFANSFYTQANVLAVQRQKEQQDVNISRLLNGIK